MPTINRSALVPFSAIITDPEGASVPPRDNFAAGYMQAVALAAGCNNLTKTEPDKVDVAADSAWTYMKRLPVELGCICLANLNTVVMNAILTKHLDELTTGHDGAYARVMVDLVD